MGYVNSNTLGAISTVSPSVLATIKARGPTPARLSDAEVESMTAEINRRIKAFEAKGIKISRDERLQITAQVQRERGLNPKFQEPLPTVPVLFPGGPAFSWGAFGTEFKDRLVNAPSNVVSYFGDQAAKGLADAGAKAKDRLGTAGIVAIAAAAGLLILYSRKRR